MSQRNITSYFKSEACEVGDETHLQRYSKTSVVGVGEKENQISDIANTNEVKNTLPIPTKGFSVHDHSEEKNYNPEKSDYHAVKDAYWKCCQRVPYFALCQTFALIEKTRGRNKMIEMLSNFFSSVIVLNPDDLLACVYLCTNQIGAVHEGLELGVAETTLMKVICNVTGRNMRCVKSEVQRTGDLGMVAEQSRHAQKMICIPSPLTVQDVYKKLKTFSTITGKTKLNAIQSTFVACRGAETRFFTRSLIGKNRIGLAEHSLLRALAIAKMTTIPFCNESVHGKLTPVDKDKIEEAVMILKTSFSQCPNYDVVVPSLIKYDLTELSERCPMKPGLPIKPMLAQPTKSIQDVFKYLNGDEITCEWKYDGERAQIHCDDHGAITIYSRNQENYTNKYPDMVDRLKKCNKDSKSYIIDSEIVAWDRELQQILPFQKLATRKRKNVVLDDIKVQICVYAFDILYLNGEPLVTKNLAERRQLLKEHFQEIEGEFVFANSYDTNDVDEIQNFLDISIKGKCEGLMIKSLKSESTYEIAKRSRSWLKLKKDYLSNVGDSLDLVVIGGYKGKGKRTGIYGGFLLACYDNEVEEYQTICKIGTGFTEEDLRVHTDFFKPHIISSPKSYYCFDSCFEPDDWFEPVCVWEVKCADLSLSPVHKAAMGAVDPEKGISLRFPRFIRIRDDKSAEDCTSSQQVADMYLMQDNIQVQSASTNNEDNF